MANNEVDRITDLKNKVDEETNRVNDRKAEEKKKKE